MREEGDSSLGLDPEKVRLKFGDLSTFHHEVERSATFFQIWYIIAEPEVVRSLCSNEIMALPCPFERQAGKWEEARSFGHVGFCRGALRGRAGVAFLLCVLTRACCTCACGFRCSAPAAGGVL